MHSLIVSRLAQESPSRTTRDASDWLETIVVRVSRLSGYVAMGVTLIGIALLIF